MLNLTPKNYGSLRHGKRSHQKKATVTKFKGICSSGWSPTAC